MPLNPATLTRLRPTLFHLTARANLEHIQRTRRLRPAVDIFAAASTPHLSGTRRAESMVVVECTPRTECPPRHRGGSSERRARPGG